MAAGRPSVPNFRSRLSVRLAQALGHTMRVLPQRVSYWAADRAGDLVYLSFPTYRDNVIANVGHVLGEQASERQVRRIARKTFQISARNFVDIVRLPHLSPEALRASVSVTPESWAVLDDLVAQGRGAVIVTAHFGPFDYVGQILWLSGYNVVLLIARTVPEFIHSAVMHLRGTHGARLEPVTPGGIRRVLTELKRGGLVGLVADRDFFQSGRPVTFFGTETTLPPGPARFARDTGAPIVPVLTKRLHRGYRLMVEQPFFVDRSNDEERDIREALERIVAIFERYIRANPEQWVMFQRVWPERPAAALRVFPVGSPLQGKLLGRGSDIAGPLTAPPDPFDPASPGARVIQNAPMDTRSSTAQGHVPD